MDLLHASLSDLRRRVRRLVVLDGVSRWCATVLTLLIVACLFDWLTHVDNPAARLVMAVFLVGTAALVCYRWIWRAAVAPLSDLDLALRWQRSRPEWQDRLASAVVFAERPDDPLQGSHRLRDRLLSDVRGELAACDLGAQWRSVLDTRAVQRSLAVALSVCLASAALVAADGARAGMALNRLFFPYSAGNWPRSTILRLLDGELTPLTEWQPLRSTAGETVTIYVENSRGRLPAELRLETRLKDGRIESHRLRTVAVRDKHGRPRDVATTSLLADVGEMEFRAVGGDDDRMPWHVLNVSPPPQVEEFEITITPPAYLGLGPQTLSGESGHLQGYLGSSVHIEARTNAVLRSAALRGDHWAVQSLRPQSDGQSLSVDFVIERPGRAAYWFDLVDTHGLRHPHPSRYEIRGLEDQPPTLALARPEADLTVTPLAEIPLRIEADDDVGLTALRLHHRVDEGVEAVLDLPLASDPPATSFREDYVWKLPPIGLQPGGQLAFHLEADDACDVGESHLTRTPPRTFLVVTPEEKREELLSRQTGIAETLQRVVELQTQNDAHLAELGIQWETAGEFRSEDLDLLKRIDHDQQRIAADLIGSRVSAAEQVRTMREEFLWNRLEDEPTRQRLNYLEQEFAVVRNQLLPELQRSLTDARRGAEHAQAEGASLPGQRSRAAAQVVPALVDAGASGRALVASLNEMLERLSDWRRRYDAVQGLDSLLADQQRVTDDTSVVGRDTLAMDVENLTAQQKADLARLAERQSRIAGRVSEVRGLLDLASEQAAEEDPAIAEELKGAAARLAEGVQAELSEAAGAIQSNNIGRASELQQSAMAAVEDARRRVADGESDGGESLLTTIAEADEAIDTMHKRQAELLQRSREAASPSADPDREQQLETLRREQQELGDSLDDLARRLRKQQLGQPAGTLSRAAARMRRAGARLESETADLALPEQQEALDDLLQARRELAKSRVDAAAEGLFSRIQEAARLVESCSQREQAILDETRRLEEIRVASGRLSRAQLRTLNQLAETQRQLQQETGPIADRLTMSSSAAVAVQFAADDMQRAADRLAERSTDASTQCWEESAVRRLKALQAVLEQQLQTQRGDDPPGDAAPEAPPEGDRPVPTFSLRSDVELLRTLQADVAARTAALVAEAAAGELTESAQLERETLAAEQSRLARLAADLLEQVRSSVPSGDEAPSE